MVVNGVDIVDKNEIVEKFNDYFLNIGSQLAATIPHTSKHYSNYLKANIPSSFCLFPTDASEVIRIVSTFKNK